MKALTLKEQMEIMEWKEHFGADHLPFRKDWKYLFYLFSPELQILINKINKINKINNYFIYFIY